MLGTGASSISISAICSSFLIKVRASSARPSRGGCPPRPRQMAQSIVDFPVPFGPHTTLRLCVAVVDVVVIQVKVQDDHFHWLVE